MLGLIHRTVLGCGPYRAVNREDAWQHTFSPRVSLSEHPLHISPDPVVTSSHLFSAAALVPRDVESVSLRSAPIAWGTITGAVGFLRWTVRKPVHSPAVTQREDASKLWSVRVWRRRL